MTPEITTAQAWQDAVNLQDIDRLLALSSPDIAVIGPRGRGVGHQLLQDWIARAGLTLTTLRIFQRGNTVVIAQRGRWQSSATGTASELDVASRLRVVDRQVIEFERYEDLPSALAAAQLSASDEYISSSR